MISTSPQKNTFQKQNYILRHIESGKSVDDPQYVAMIQWYESWDKIDEQNIDDPEWRKDNLEWDLRTTNWILEKVRINEIYAQHLYAALCNNDFARPDDVFKILAEDFWSCSWRHAGGIISDMRCEGDYVDWYNSGITDAYTDGPGPVAQNYVSEGTVTDEIRQDLEKLGWMVIFNKDNL